MDYSVKFGNGPQLRRTVGQGYEHIVRVTPAPAFWRVITFDNGMAAIVEMRGSVTILGIVATADMPACPA